MTETTTLSDLLTMIVETIKNAPHMIDAPIYHKGLDGVKPICEIECVQFFREEIEEGIEHHFIIQ